VEDIWWVLNVQTVLNIIMSTIGELHASECQVWMLKNICHIEGYRLAGMRIWWETSGWKWVSDEVGEGKGGAG
jgi:hypothetical protein